MSDEQTSMSENTESDRGDKPAEIEQRERELAESYFRWLVRQARRRAG